MLAIVGPTASGKSAVGNFLIKNFNSSIINFDSCQVYSGLPILKSIPTDLNYHHLYSFNSHSFPFNAFSWGNLALESVNCILSENRNPVLIGGTAFYLKAFMDGIDCLPPIVPSIQSFVDELSNFDVRKMLKEKDADILNVYFDDRRLRKSLAFYLSNGVSLLKSYGNYLHIFYSGYVCVLALIPPRAVLLSKIYERLHCDFDSMVEEVRVFDLNASSIIGFSEINLLLEGKISKSSCLDLIFIRTRRYAKRQVTFIKNSLKIVDTFSDANALKSYLVKNKHLLKC